MMRFRLRKNGGRPVVRGEIKAMHSEEDGSGKEALTKCNEAGLSKQEWEICNPRSLAARDQVA